VILTGANQDGARGLAKIKQQGGLTMVEDPVTALCREMPDAAINLTKVDRILTLQEMAADLLKLSKYACVV
jgi:two-component system chemotaxis response regulator CheB